MINSSETKTLREKKNCIKWFSEIIISMGDKKEYLCMCERYKYTVRWKIKKKVEEALKSRSVY